MNAIHWMMNANATHRAKRGTPETTMPPWLPANASPAAINKMTAIAMTERIVTLSIISPSFGKFNF
jgi:hypothetical protein